jgi:hypothetical protein
MLEGLVKPQHSSMNTKNIGTSAHASDVRAPMRGFVRAPPATVKPAPDRMARRVFTAWALGAGVSALLPGRAQSAAPDRVSAFVDFSSRIASRSMNGFLNSIHHPNPPSERIRPLQPNLWRSNDLRQHGAIRSWGAEFEGPLSDGWGYPLNGNWKPPYENVAAWEAFVRRIAELSRGKEIYWDIWNEPDTLGSWRGTRDAFFATWIRAAAVFKATLGPDTKVGPSSSSFQPAFLEGFRHTHRQHSSRHLRRGVGRPRRPGLIRPRQRGIP